MREGVAVGLVLVSMLVTPFPLLLVLRSVNMLTLRLNH